MLQKEWRQNKLIWELEGQHCKALGAQKHEFEPLQAEKEVWAAPAKWKVYDKEAEGGTVYYTNNESDKETKEVPVTAVPPPNVTAPSHTDISSLPQAFQDSIALIRLPVPEPVVFSGDPIWFIQRKSVFTWLVDQRAINPAEKPYYLKKYVCGPARQGLQNTFYRSDNEIYQDVWKQCNCCFGQPIAIQKAFRERLSNWQRIQPKEAEGLRNFSDFLNACQDAMPHVKGLDILNDCEENQKLVHKLPDRLTSRWNSLVTRSLNEKQEFPSFKEFASLLSTEAKIAWNPITSLMLFIHQALVLKEENLQNVKRNKANVHTTQTVAKNDEQRSDQGKANTPWILCQNTRHQLHARSKFTEMSLIKRRNYVRKKTSAMDVLNMATAQKTVTIFISVTPARESIQQPFMTPQVKDGPSSEIRTNPAAMSLNVTGVMSSNTPMVMLVWVSSKKYPAVEKLACALLETMSDTTLIDQAVSDKLDADKHLVKLN